MTDAIGAVRAGVVTGVAQRAAAANTVVSTTTSGASDSSEIPPLSPAIRFDPKSGVVITEYFDRDGKVATQIPSAASMAYRRSSPTHMDEPSQKVSTETTAPSQAVEA